MNVDIDRKFVRFAHKLMNLATLTPEQERAIAWWSGRMNARVRYARLAWGDEGLVVVACTLTRGISQEECVAAITAVQAVTEAASSGKALFEPRIAAEYLSMVGGVSP